LATIKQEKEQKMDETRRTMRTIDDHVLLTLSEP
jgi:hypothetical protein